jgi:hypothetical protein
MDRFKILMLAAMMSCAWTAGAQAGQGAIGGGGGGDVVLPDCDPDGPTVIQLAPIYRDGMCMCVTPQERAQMCEGCFAPDTPILMADGSWKAVEGLLPTEQLWNPVTKKIVKVKKLVVGPEPLPLIEFGYEGRTVKVSTRHPIVTKAGIKRAEELVPGDVIYDTEGNEHLLTVLRALPMVEGQYVVNIKLAVSGTASADDHVIVANGIRVGDFELQERFGRRADAARREPVVPQDDGAALRALPAQEKSRIR